MSFFSLQLLSSFLAAKYQIFDVQRGDFNTWMSLFPSLDGRARQCACSSRHRVWADNSLKPPPRASPADLPLLAGLCIWHVLWLKSSKTVPLQQGLKVRGFGFQKKIMQCKTALPVFPSLDCRMRQRVVSSVPFPYRFPFQIHCELVSSLLALDATEPVSQPLTQMAVELINIYLISVKQKK